MEMLTWGSQVPAPLQCGRVPPQPGISLWQEGRDYTEFTELFCRVTRTWQDTLLSFTGHRFSHQHKTSAGLSELQCPALLVSLAEGRQG